MHKYINRISKKIHRVQKMGKLQKGIAAQVPLQFYDYNINYYAYI